MVAEGGEFSGDSSFTLTKGLQSSKALLLEMHFLLSIVMQQRNSSRQNKEKLYNNAPKTLIFIGMFLFTNFIKVYVLKKNFGRKIK